MSRRSGRAILAALAALGSAVAAASMAACAMPEPPNRVALVYGVSIYLESLPQTKRPNLSLTDDDAYAIGA
ncbi:MAG TPA: hypothetical protein PLW80_01425, partial [Spirochaetales bacterium]|nr:hypothetical protein [Spirochaetales bacterium]